LKARVVRNRASPGKIISQGANRKAVPASASMAPHDGVVSGTPTPKNESPASNRMLLGMIRVVYTMIGAATFGRTSRRMIRRFEAPSEREASTNSFSRIDSTWPRTMRPMYGHPNNPMIKITGRNPGLMKPQKHPSWLAPHAEAMPSANSRIGSASTTSVAREMIVSILPR
jgi:hypothetical protein